MFFKVCRNLTKLPNRIGNVHEITIKLLVDEVYEFCAEYSRRRTAVQTLLLATVSWRSPRPAVGAGVGAVGVAVGAAVGAGVGLGVGRVVPSADVGYGVGLAEGAGVGADVGAYVAMNFVHHLTNFRRLVCGCMDSYDSERSHILQHFSSSTR